MEYFEIFIGGIFINNILLAQFLGNCPFLGTSKKMETAVGMAMAVKAGLVVPVIKDTDNKSIIEVAKDRVDLIDKGRNGKLGPKQMTGGTFTVSAMGMFGTDIFTAIINQPENAILGVGTIKDKPVVVDGQIVIRPMMNLALSYDHRTIDGANAGRFMQTLKQFMEDPMMILAG